MTDNFCNKCGACCKHIKADFSEKILYWDGIQSLDDEFAAMLIPKAGAKNIFECKYLRNNLCVNPAKPDICKNYPVSPFAELPDECGYNGFIFMKNEKIRQKIRKLKEEIIHYNAIISTLQDKREQNQLNKIISSHQRFIKKYEEYGAVDW